MLIESFDRKLNFMMRTNAFFRKLGKKFKSFLAIGVELNPFVVLILGLLAAATLGMSTIERKSFRTGPMRFQLSSSPTFEKILQCSEIESASVCFDKHRKNLLKESGPFLSPFGEPQLQTCLSIASKNPNDISLLLNLQTCYHQVDIIERATEFSYALPKTSWWTTMGIFLSISMQLFVAVHSFVVFVMRKREFSDIHDSIHRLNQDNYLRLEKERELNSYLGSVSINTNSELAKLKSKVSDTENVSLELKKLEENLALLKKQVYYSNTRLLEAISKQEREFVLQKKHSYNTTRYYDPSPLTQNSKFDKDKQNDKKKEKEQDNSNKRTEKEKKREEHSFDLTTESGREAWKSYIQKSLAFKPKGNLLDKENKSTQATQVKVTTNQCSDRLKSIKNISSWENSPQKTITTTTGSTLTLAAQSLKDDNILGASVKTLIANTNSSEQVDGKHLGTASSPLEVSINDIQQVDKNGRPFRRIFVPGRGWLAAKTFRSEVDSGAIKLVTETETTIPTN
ncbi:BA75_00053T0 [Komagataella pastoris]|uniref:BA75_00053T0 n=1 Tax=Komagataella pastoris TaxID=4922 RepID=A0A1B2J780_PICPA|nr:BA75_00053T0 [Komagataella pastoris]